MAYLDKSRLMDESERIVHERAVNGDMIVRRACAQLVSDRPRYRQWRAEHEVEMTDVAELRRRRKQILRLRAVAVEQVHRTALVRYFHDYAVAGEDREEILKEHCGYKNLRRAVIIEHHNYLLGTSTQVSARHVLRLAGDARGVVLIKRYETSYGQYFSLFCDQARAQRRDVPYLLGALIPEANDSACALRKRILAGRLMPPKSLFFRAIPAS